jgi:hypothetical protein
MDTWTESAMRELEVELKRLELDVEAKRVAAEQAQAAYEAVLAEQAMVRRMFEWTRGRQVRGAEEPAPASMPIVVSPQAELAHPIISELCIQVLTQLGGPVATTEVRQRLEQAGYEFRQDQVRSALKYLASKKKNPPVEGVRPGVYRLRGRTGYVPPESASVPAMNGTREGP